MQPFYAPEDYREWARRLEQDLSRPISEPLRAEKLAHLHPLSAAAGDGERGEVFAAMLRDALLALDETGQAMFEPLLLALQARDDRSILARIAREKRDLVLDVMQRMDSRTKQQ